MLSELKQEIIKILKEVGIEKIEKIEKPEEEFGDLAFPCFPLAREFKKSPKEIAEEIVKKIVLPKDSLFSKVEAKSGYVNFFFNYPKITEKVLTQILKEKEKYGSSNIGRGKKVIVEFPSVNPGKPWHIGHARNAILGDSIRRILRFSGFNVEAQDYIDDLGLQVAQVLWGILNLKDLPKKEGLLKKEDQWQGRVYVKVANLFKDKPEVEKEVREIMKKIEEGSPEIKEIHKKIVDDCLKAQYETAFRLKIYHDLKIHESDIVHSGLFEMGLEKIKENEKIVLEESGKNKGCLVAKLEELEEFKGMKEPDKILIRSDGTSTYTGKDLVFQMWKFGIIKDPMKYKIWIKQPNGEYIWTTAEDGKPNKKFANADMVINVIGSEQSYPQKVLYYILKLMGYEKEFENSVHLSYEHVTFKEEHAPKHFSGRKGTWIGYSVDEVLNKAVSLALKEVKERNKDLSEKSMKEIAEKIGCGAIKYVMLSTDWEKQVVFSYKEALSFEGDTGPYLQYAHTRCLGILKKAEKWKENFETEKLEEGEKELVKKLLEFPEIVKKAGKDLKPHYICNYAYQLAGVFSEFYHTCPVLKAETQEKRNFRLTLVKSTEIVLKNALNLLGIETPERM